MVIGVGALRSGVPAGWVQDGCCLARGGPGSGLSVPWAWCHGR
jgi:hypothetical protein